MGENDNPTAPGEAGVAGNLPAVTVTRFICASVTPCVLPGEAGEMRSTVELIEESPDGTTAAHVLISRAQPGLFREGRRYQSYLVDCEVAPGLQMLPGQCRANPMRVHDFYPLQVRTVMVNGLATGPFVDAHVVCRYCGESRAIER